MGIAALPAPSMDGMAGGGIIAFAGPDGSEVEDPDLEYLNLAEKQRNMALQRAGIMNPANSKMKEYLAKFSPVTPTLRHDAKILDGPQTLLSQVTGVDYTFS
jgi:hypothetical protein